MIRLGLIISAFAFVLAVIFSAYGWINTEPGAQVPVHFNLSGEADSYGSKTEAFLFLPAILLGITFLLAIAPNIDPRGKNLRRSRPVYIVGWIIGVVALAGGQGLITWTAVGGGVEGEVMARGVGIFIAAIMLLLGLVIAKARPNFFAGIRTPWTLSSDLSWDKTHRWASRVFLGLGVAGLAAALLLPPEPVTIGLMAALLVSTLGLVIYSFLVWQADPARETLNPDDADEDAGV
ncbi:SdpI family protein [Hyphobacterium sp. CCMP332]|uniref:SdpI family protein n=1 Tax=Hyphobacterium sp. CCMP332 TaxID=2749086 RepID=UPI00164FEC7F|nr:SdpI family protein [Hyphobacterium sp. CCMP332]QNL20001.1 SdpI family protein [Hyphobacterium sp. CCMP332]